MGLSKRLSVPCLPEDSRGSQEGNLLGGREGLGTQVSYSMPGLSEKLTVPISSHWDFSGLGVALRVRVPEGQTFYLCWPLGPPGPQEFCSNHLMAFPMQWAGLEDGQ